MVQFTLGLVNMRNCWHTVVLDRLLDEGLRYLGRIGFVKHVELGEFKVFLTTTRCNIITDLPQFILPAKFFWAIHIFLLILLLRSFQFCKLVSICSTRVLFA